jgi:glycyl-tRNA synthetase
MSEPVEDIFSLNAAIATQGTVVRGLKKGGGSADEISAEVAKLLALREKLAALVAMEEVVDTFNRTSFDQLMLRKMYIIPSFEIHNGPSGFFDLGPPACALKANIVSQWRKHFVVNENMLEMECTNLTPSVVLEASGHVERFTDFMTRDEITGECFRADKLLEQSIDDYLETNKLTLTSDEKEKHLRIQRQADGYTAEELYNLFKEYNIKSPSNNENNLTLPQPFNMMFKTMIGPDGKSVGYLRPETAQGLFVNFKRLLEYNQTRMPFSAAQIGTSFRNEIAPKGGLLRVREFSMAEIEHFVHPNDKSHPKFNDVKDIEICLFSANDQLTTGRTINITAGDAVKNKIIDNETLTYFMVRTFLFLKRIGVDSSRMRFRQHLKTEMAHYSQDCWDMEIEMSSGWTECVGHADRACYDLEVHGKATNTSMTAATLLDKPLKVEKLIAEPIKKKLGPKFGKDAKLVIDVLENLNEDEVKELQIKFETSDVQIIKSYEINKDMLNIKIEKKTISEEKYLPHVIEPSFGLGRVLNAVLEHSFSQRNGDENRCVMAFRPCVAPIKLGIFRLVTSPLLDILVNKLSNTISESGIVYKVDSTSGTVGKRYARSDEIGIPFGCTVDFKSLNDNTVTLRDRDTMAQIRISISDVPTVVNSLCNEEITFEQVMEIYPVVKEAGDDEEEDKEKEKKSKDKDEDASKKVKDVVEKPLIIETTFRGMFSRPNPAYKA